MALTPDQVPDFVELTIPAYDMKKWVDLSLNLQHLCFAGRLATVKKVPKQGTHRLEWKIQTKNTSTFKHSGLFDTASTAVEDLATNAYEYWTKQTANYSFDVDEEIFQAPSANVIVDEMKMRQHSMYTEFFEGMEYAMWSTPTTISAPNENRVPSGIPHWITEGTYADATEERGGFHGGDPSGYSLGAGHILEANVANWHNWAAKYKTVSRDDLIEKLIEAMDKTYFQAPHNFQELRGGTPDWCLYTVYPVLSSCRKQLQANNDNLGNDVAALSGEVLVRGNPLKWVPALTNSDSPVYDSNEPVYGVNWRSLEYFFHSARMMKVTKPMENGIQPTTRTVHLFNWGNFRALDRRQLFRIHK